MAKSRKLRETIEEKPHSPKGGKASKCRKALTAKSDSAAESRAKSSSKATKAKASDTPVSTGRRSGEQLSEKKPPEPSFENLREFLSDAIQESGKNPRQAIPSALAKQGLPETLHHLLRQIGAAHSVKTRLKVSRGFHMNNSRVALHLYFIAREAAINAIEHGHAQSITILLSFSPEHVKMRVRNDGRPFSLDKAREHIGKGLMGIELRVRLMEGTWLIHAPRRQTEVLVEVPEKIRPLRRPKKSPKVEKLTAEQKRAALTKSFSTQELRVYLLLSQGLKHGEIAKAMGVGYKTVETYLTRMKEKLGLLSTRELALHAVKHA